MKLLTTKRVLLFVSAILLLLVFPDGLRAQSSSPQTCFQKYALADSLYLEGKKTEAAELYSQCKTPDVLSIKQVPEAIEDPALLSPGGKVYWTKANEGWQNEPRLESKIFVPLKFLLDEHPEFIPGYVLLAEASDYYERPEAALSALETAASLFPESEKLARLQIDLLEKNKQWMNASIAARQFISINPEHPAAAEFKQFSEQNYERFQDQLNEELIGGSIASAAVSILTGSESGIGRTEQLAKYLFEGESAFGSQIANEYKTRLKLIKDPLVDGYIDIIGQSMAQQMGRSEFDYEFYVIQDEALNAFTLPGGKVFINTGALLAMSSVAELAGLLSHEIAHAVLSHSYQSLITNTLLGGIGDIIPFGEFVSSLSSLEYSRSQEQEADLLGTRALAASGYAADGMKHFFVRSKKYGATIAEYLSTHPAPDTRIQYIDNLIDRNGYNRYAYEGVEHYAAIKIRLEEILDHSN